MNTPASAVVPSREAVEKVRRELLSNSPIDHGEFCRVRTDTAGKAWEMLRTLLAEVESLRTRCANWARLLGEEIDARQEERNQLRAEVERLTDLIDGYKQVCGNLRATVADQAAALAERDKLLERAAVSMRHARVFIQTREKMHPDGQVLHNEDLAAIDAALAARRTMGVI